MTNTLMSQVMLTSDAVLEWKRKCEDFMQDYILEHDKLPDTISKEELKLKEGRLILFCKINENEEIKYEIPDDDWGWKS